MSVRSRRPLAALALAVVASACGSDSSLAPARATNTLDRAFTELAIPAISAVAPSMSSVDGQHVTPLISGPSSCAYAPATRNFTCPSVHAGNLTITQSYTLLDASGAPQPAFDPATTAAVRTDGSLVDGNITGRITGTLDATHTLTLSGLLTGVHRLDGVTTTHFKGTASAVNFATPLTTASTTTIAGLVLPATAGTATSPAWPVSGTITTESETTTGTVPTIRSRIQITFNGTSRVAVVVTVAGVTRSCTVDVGIGAPVCA